jgi:DNA-directed RNA polymerase subunit RPC12/RpoP
MADKFYCKKCGRQFASLSSLVNTSCLKGGKCESYEGPVQPKYLCKKCGREFSSLSSLVNTSCLKGGKCEPAR